MLDENLSPRIANALVALVGNRPGYEVGYVRQDHGRGTDDPSWLAAFAAQDGTAIVSGDHKILLHWPNLVAYKATDLISFFPPSEFDRINGFGKAAFLIRWWPVIVEKIKLSQQGDRWRLKYKWTNMHNGDMELLKDPRVDDVKTKCDEVSGAKVYQLGPRGGLR
jgi:hypothetical protein